MKVYYHDIDNAIESAGELSKTERRSIWVFASRSPGCIEYILKNDEQIMDFDSPDIVHVENYQPGKAKFKPIKEILGQ